MPSVSVRRNCLICLKPFTRTLYPSQLALAKLGKFRIGRYCGLPCFAKGKRTRKPISVRFWKHVLKTKTCWLWTASLDSGGYGQLAYQPGKPMRASRISWIIHHGAIPKQFSVLHKCDNRPCVRPTHLYLGTQHDNVHDCISRGRFTTKKKHAL